MRFATIAAAILALIPAPAMGPRPAPQRRERALHALLLSARSDLGSSGQRGRPGASSPSIIPSRSRSTPAQAIIAPLSVQSLGGGATRGGPAPAHNWVSPSRRALLAATPPAPTPA